MLLANCRIFVTKHACVHEGDVETSRGSDERRFGRNGGAKLADGLQAHLGSALTVIVNTGDDLELHGLLVCPDLDTIMYTLAGLANEATGWGVRDETWSALRFKVVE